jgi:peptidyl-prolyl cis-trans isomerase C
MNRTLRHALLLAFAVSVSSAPAFAQKKAEPAAKADSATVATVNGKAIPNARANALVAGQAAQGQPDSPELRKAVREELIRREDPDPGIHQEGLRQEARNTRSDGPRPSAVY